MGIYTDEDHIFGIRIYTYINDEEEIKMLYEKTYHTVINEQQIQDMKNIYFKLTETHPTQTLKFQIYCEFSSTLDIVNRGKFMKWHFISHERFIQKFKLQ
jgi:hypothetical protein